MLPERHLRLEHRPNAPSVRFFGGEVLPSDCEWECPLRPQWGLVMLLRCVWSQLHVPEAPAHRGAARGLVLSLASVHPLLWPGSQGTAPTLAFTSPLGCESPP